MAHHGQQHFVPPTQYTEAKPPGVPWWIRAYSALLCGAFGFGAVYFHLAYWDKLHRLAVIVGCAAFGWLLLGWLIKQLSRLPNEAKYIRGALVAAVTALCWCPNYYLSAGLSVLILIPFVWVDFSVSHHPQQAHGLAEEYWAGPSPAWAAPGPDSAAGPPPAWPPAAAPPEGV